MKLIMQEIKANVELSLHRRFKTEELGVGGGGEPERPEEHSS